MGMGTLRHQLDAIKAQLSTLSAIPVACADAVELWRRIYGAAPDPWQRDVLVYEHPRLLTGRGNRAKALSVRF
jgi:hypothetical protein